jgi:hypothetical protein
VRGNPRKKRTAAGRLAIMSRAAKALARATAAARAKAPIHLPHSGITLDAVKNEDRRLKEQGETVVVISPQNGERGANGDLAAQDQGAAISGREVDVEHLDGGELVEHGPGRDAAAHAERQ